MPIIYLQVTDPGYEPVKELSGIGRCPYDPDHNSTAVFSGKFKVYQAAVMISSFRTERSWQTRTLIRVYTVCLSVCNIGTPKNIAVIILKILKNSDTRKNALIILKLEQYHFTAE